jgi:hypothetical protein
VAFGLDGQVQKWFRAHPAAQRPVPSHPRGLVVFLPDVDVLLDARRLRANVDGRRRFVSAARARARGLGGGAG